MKLSIYTSVRNGLFFDFHVVEMLMHHVGLADEIVVNEGYSDDGTYERIKDLHPKIRVFRTSWDRSRPDAWHRTFGDEARRACTGEWCLKLDCDEFIPEWDFDRLRALIASTPRRVLPLRFLNFYANYKVLNVVTLPHYKWVLHRNEEAEVVGDGSNVRVFSEEWGEIPEDSVYCHHFGAVRHAARLRQKWRNDGMMKRALPRFDHLPGFVYDLMPHNWLDRDFLNDLRPYEGPYVAAVVNNPEEFIRDGMKTYDYVRRHQKPYSPYTGQTAKTGSAE